MLRNVKDQNESSLTHYGIKGMKWGVRKEQERSGKFKPKSKSEADSAIRENKKKIAAQGGNYKNQFLQTKTKGYLEKVDEYNNVDSRLGSAYSTAVWVQNMSKQTDKYPHFQQFMKDVSVGSSKRDSALNDFLKNYKESTGNNFNVDEAYKRLATLASNGKTYGYLSDEEWAELAELTEYCDALMNYYTQTYSRLPTEEEKELQEKIKKAQDNIRKAVLDSGINLREGQSLGAIDRGNGSIVYSYTKNGKTVYYADLKDALAVAEADSEKLKDFRNRPSATRTREKNVDLSSDPVSIKKGQKIETSEKERSEKKMSSPSASKTTKQLTDIMKLKGEYGENAIKRNKIIRDANLQRNGKSLSTMQTTIKPKTKVSTLSKAKNAIQSGANVVEKRTKSAFSSLKKFANSGKSAISKLFKSTHYVEWEMR